MKILEGNPGKRPLNDREPKPKVIEPAQPDHLSERARAEWDRLVAILAPLGVLTEADGDILAVYCQTYDRWIQASTELDRQGLVVLTEKGYPIQNPYLPIVNQCVKTMHRCMTELGLTPSARSRLVVNTDETDEFENLFGS